MAELCADAAGEVGCFFVFQAANHRSIDRPVELSMIAVDEDRAAT